jgi:hypothetical protein
MELLIPVTSKPIQISYHHRIRNRSIPHEQDSPLEVKLHTQESQLVHVWIVIHDFMEAI